MPRRTHNIPLTVAALAAGLLLALGVAACGGGSQSAGTLETPPLTVGTGVTMPSTTSSATTTTSTTTTGSTDTGGATETGDTGGAVDTGGDTTGGTTGGDTGGGTTPPTGGGGTTTPTQPSNPGGASPDYQSFCDENPGAC